MQTTTLNVAAMFGDHHVMEVRRILLEIPGVADVYASSAFGVVEVSYDENKVAVSRFESALADAGYMETLSVPVESEVPVNLLEDGQTYFRHTSAYAQTNQTVGFGQQVAATDRPLWPCPGLGPIRMMDE